MNPFKVNQQGSPGSAMLMTEVLEGSGLVVQVAGGPQKSPALPTPAARIPIKRLGWSLLAPASWKSTLASTTGHGGSNATIPIDMIEYVYIMFIGFIQFV